MAPPRFELLRIGEGDTACEQHRDPLFSAVMRVPDFLSAADCATIVAAADSHLAAMREAQALNPSPRSRLPVANLRCERARTAVERAFDQLLRFLEADAPHEALACFGASSGLASLRKRFTGLEPAVTVYAATGGFSPHQEHEPITMLINLSPEDAF